MTAEAAHIGFVAIGRNEGERLKRCLNSLSRISSRVVYVDSGSVDASAAFAEEIGASVVRLSADRPFTAARARNAGFDRLLATWPDCRRVMFIDGDCELVDGWIEAGEAALDADRNIAAICGRLRERHPEASLYNRLCDAEWDTPVGETDACGGIALFAVEAFRDAGGFREDLIAGEEPELCLRLRERGWRFRRVDADMALHDAAMMRFSQWWRRATRAGHAFAEVSQLHRSSPKRIWARETIRAAAWALIAPVALLGGLFVHWTALLLLLAYPLQVIRIAMRERERAGRDALAFGFFNTLAKFAEAQGIAGYWLSRLRRRPVSLKEYKTAQQ